MTVIREAELPGLGKKYQMTLENKDQIVVIIHDDGMREVFYFGDDADEPLASVSLSDQESRQLGSIIGGAFYQPRSLDTLEAAISGLRIEWLSIKGNSGIAGKSIGEMGLRKNHKIVIIAVLKETCRGHKEAIHISPGPNYVFEPGHIVIAAGQNDKMKEFQKMFR